MLAHPFERGLELAVAIERDNLAGLRNADHFADAAHHAADARLRQRSGALQFDQQNLIDVAVPVALRPASEEAAADESRLIVVGAEIDRAGMRDVDGDERDVGFHIFGGDGRGDHLVGLEFDHQVDLFFDEVVGVAQCDLRLIAVVDGEQFDVLAFGGARQAVAHLAIERGVLALRGIADAVEPPPADFGRQPVVILADLIQEAALVQRVEQAETHALVVAGASHDIAQAQYVARGLKGLEHA